MSSNFFESFNPGFRLPNKYEKEGGLELGLSEAQVSIQNFGWHTINAIKSAMSDGSSLFEAYERFHGLGNMQITGMTELGLEPKHVTSANFGWHTINAVKSITKRTREISAVEAFNMIRGLSYSETKKVLEKYLASTKKPMKSLVEMELIRVLVNTGGNFGHQRAAITLMQKLREMGFGGTFDIQCDDRLGASLFDASARSEIINTKPLVSQKLKSMIPGFEHSPLLPDGTRDIPGIGKVRLSSLPHDYERSSTFSLTKADLAVCAAEDSLIMKKEKRPEIFNSSAYIGLEPTDWYQGYCFVVDEDGIVTELASAEESRLSSRTSVQPFDLKSIEISPVEARALDIAANPAVNSQLVYGLFSEFSIDMESSDGRMELNGKLDQVTEMQRIVEANLSLSLVSGKPTVLLVPQEIALDSEFIRKVQSGNPNVFFVDLCRGPIDLTKYEPGQVVISYTGRLQQAVFDHLMLEGTTLAPVIEGCNSVELCESMGRPFIHGAGKFCGLKRYDVALGDNQELHASASLCLEQGDPKYLPNLVQYMKGTLEGNVELHEYHEQRRSAFLSRPEACELAFDALGIPYNSSLLQENKKVEISAAVPMTPRNCTEFFRRILEKAFKCKRSPNPIGPKL
jgi:hypothetical protein